MGSSFIKNKVSFHKDARTRRRAKTGLLFTLPALIFLGLMVLYPIIWSFYRSLHSFSMFNIFEKPEFVGLNNYIELLGSSEFRNVLLQQFGFVATTVSCELVLGFVIALLLNKEIKGKKFFRIIFTLPLMVSPTVAGLQWRWLYADQYGVLNNILAFFGINGPMWLADVWGARAGVLIANLWLAMPFVVLVLLAGMSSLPEEPFEAARIDGARNFQIFRYIMLPLLRPSLLIILVVRLTDAMRVFDIVYILTKGGPGGATDVVSTFIYRIGFTELRFAESAAASFILVALIVVLSLVCIKTLRPKEDGMS